MSAVVRKYLTQDLSEKEKKSYNEYIKGNEKSTFWMEKALLRREPLLYIELQCQHKENDVICSAWVNISETGICKCSKNHLCYDQVLQVLKNIT